MVYAVEITKHLTVPGLGELYPGDVVLEGDSEPGIYRPIPPDTNILLHIFAAEAGELLNPDPQRPDLAAVVGLSGPYQLAPSPAPGSPAPPVPVARRRLRRLK